MTAPPSPQHDGTHDNGTGGSDGRAAGGSDGTATAPVAAARRRGHVAPYVAGAVAVVLVMFVWLLATRDVGDDALASSPLLGKVAPPIAGSGFRGEAFDLDAERGKWVVVNFFSTTCIPCVIEHPELVELDRRRAPAGDLSIVSVTFDDSPASVRDFFEKHGGEWPVLLTDTGRIAVSYGVAAVPESYIIAPNGVVARKIIGGVTADGIESLLTRLGA